MSHLAFVGTRQEYRDFLETRYRDGTWGNPLCAWAIDWFKRNAEDVPDTDIILDDKLAVLLSFKTGDYYDDGGHDGTSEGCIRLMLPEWSRPLWQFYWDRDQIPEYEQPRTEWKRANALAHLATYAPE